MQTNEIWDLINQENVQGNHIEVARLYKKMFKKTKDISALVWCCETLRLVGDSLELHKQLDSITLKEIEQTLGPYGTFLAAEKIKTLSLNQIMTDRDRN